GQLRSFCLKLRHGEAFPDLRTDFLQRGVGSFGEVALRFLPEPGLERGQRVAVLAGVRHPDLVARPLRPRLQRTNLDASGVRRISDRAAPRESFGHRAELN